MVLQNKQIISKQPSNFAFLDFCHYLFDEHQLKPHLSNTVNKF